MCDNFAVSMRVPSIIALCVALMAVRSLWLHSHVSHWDDDELAEQRHAAVHGAHSGHTTALEAGADHIDAHVDHGDVDLDEPTIATAKSLLLKAPVALVSLVCTTLLTGSCLLLPLSQPPHRLPKSRSKPYLFPPSLARATARGLSG